MISFCLSNEIPGSNCPEVLDLVLRHPPLLLEEAGWDWVLEVQEMGVDWTTEGSGFRAPAADP